MKVDDIINLDYRKEESKSKIQIELKKLKPFEKIKGDVSIVNLEKFISKAMTKYDVILQYISVSRTNGKLLYSASIKNSKGDWLGTIYGIMIEEVYAKLCIKIFDMIKKKEIHKNES